MSFFEAMLGSKVGQDLSAPGTRAQVSPQQAEKDRAVAVARRVLAGSEPAGWAVEDVRLLARQFLRALALTE